MPPRNSNTTTYKPYRKEGRSAKIPIEHIYDSILKPEKSINNPIFKEFEAYKQKAIFDGIDIEEKIQNIFKDDQDGDERYVNSDWYQDRLKG